MASSNSEKVSSGSTTIIDLVFHFPPKKIIIVIEKGSWISPIGLPGRIVLLVGVLIMGVLHSSWERHE